MAKYSIKEKEGTIINSVREDFFSAYAKAELNDPERVAYWQSLFEKQFKPPKQEKTLCQMAVLYCCAMVEKVENAAIMQ